LYNRFKRLDKNNSGALTTEDILSIPELAMNPLINRVISLLILNKKDSLEGDVLINFKQFVEIISAFSDHGKVEDKLKIAFAVYDLNGDGFITQDELCTTLKLMVGNNLTQDQIKLIAIKTIDQYDLDGDGKINREEFNKLVSTEDIMKKMSIQFKKL